MKNLWLLFVLGLALPGLSFAAVYDCVVPAETLGEEFTDDLSFVLETHDDGTATLDMMGDLVADDCSVEGLKVTCHDDEGMPYLMTILSLTKVEIQIGPYVDTTATCNDTDES